MRTFAIAFITALALTGAAAAQTPSTTPTPAAVATPPGAYSAVIHIKNFAFGPATVTVKAGQAVAWINDDDAAHTVTAVDTSFDSGNMDKGGTYTHTFRTPGTYGYYCTYHSYMKAIVIVK